MSRTRALIPEIAPATAIAEASPLPTSLGLNTRGQMGRNVYESIRNAILDCTFLPGIALSEQSVSDSLAVSRAPVREAFRQLATEGLLEAIPQRGSYVAKLSAAKIMDAIFVREMIECKAAELAAHAPIASRKELGKILRQQIQASARQDYAAHLNSDETFHYQILVLAGHPHAWASLRQARTGMNRIRHLAIPELGSNKIAIDHHKTIAQAIMAGDAAQARKAMLIHIQSPQLFLEAIRKRHPEYFEIA